MLLLFHLMILNLHKYANLTPAAAAPVTGMNPQPDIPLNPTPLQHSPETKLSWNSRTKSTSSEIVPLAPIERQLTRNNELSRDGAKSSAASTAKNLHYPTQLTNCAAV
ncbi:hypothetical protein ACLKA7_007095 [Drosophila subpalustris]